jgi:hypothetical protein
MTRANVGLPLLGEELNLRLLQTIFAEALDGMSGIKPMPGFSMMPSETPIMFRLFFRVHCPCGAAALLRLEIAKTKRLDDIKTALPSLIQQLSQQESTFTNLSCEDHGRLANLKANRSGLSSSKIQSAQ